ncbi:uncharacterized protein SPSK_03706 [Sporothrix schenckii 1099-18]|uniref:Uncharacterized protein n=1 Tax=Sporothrix schenckii 1099-18 TaxID=1397361 RepID=A0A0F2M0T9_SPOSC|nr:uncharacterized protein SPSK_03706 [Sporothrix schenckii 1099-18]KJR82694.1 hypothetical protein SPSK_03706 [Sporothrix schenckii 1099-18]
MCDPVGIYQGSVCVCDDACHGRGQTNTTNNKSQGENQTENKGGTMGPSIIGGKHDELHREPSVERGHFFDNGTTDNAATQTISTAVNAEQKRCACYGDHEAQDKEKTARGCKHWLVLNLVSMLVAGYIARAVIPSNGRGSLA